jgi:hypothetical protein
VSGCSQVQKLLAAIALIFIFAAPASAQTSAFEQDRRAILAMAGTYRVGFEFRETVALTPGYTPLPLKTSGGEEVIRVIEDTGRTIKLQHILVAQIDGKPYITKHWRQDWTYEPAQVLTYIGGSRWTLRPVKAEDRKGAWSQTVWQTDDSPRYGGVGRWAHDLGYSRWTSDISARPLARRDAVRKPPYDRYVGTNRHTLTPEGWVHEQDNAKVGMKDGREVTFVHEVALNTYRRSDRFNWAAADAYWAKTKDYWAQVRAGWDRQFARNRVVTVAEEAQMGSLTSPLLMDLAEKIADGKTTTARAAAIAAPFIASDDAERRRVLKAYE